MRCLIAVLMMTGVVLAAPQRNGQADILYERAVQKETADGDLKAALDLYKQAVVKAGSNRAVAAKALIRMGQCHEKLGDAEARKVYERVVSEFGDQKEAVAEARRRLGFKAGQAAGVLARKIPMPEAEPSLIQEVTSDGRYLVCRNRAGEIYLRDIESGARRVILGESRVFRHPLRLSPDGRQLAFVSVAQPGATPPELHVVRVDGSAVRVFTAKELGGMPRMPALAGWTPDGQSLLVGTLTEDGQRKFVFVRVSDGAVRNLRSSQAISGSIHQMKISPDGQFLAYTRAGGPGYMGKGISVRTLDGSRDTILSDDGINPLWTPDGKRVLFTSNRRGPTDLWAIPVYYGQPAGPPEMVREAVTWLVGITRDGELFHKTAYETRDLYSVELDPQSGRATSKPIKLTHRYTNTGPVWSPDGKLLAYASIRDGMEPGAGDPASLVVRTMASGEERVVAPRVPLDMNLANPQWFPGGRALLIQPQWGPQGGKLAKVDIDTGGVELLPAPRVWSNSGNWYDAGATLSPDGRTLYFPSAGGEPGKVRIVRRELPSGDERELRTLNASRPVHISVSPDGNHLAFWVDGTLMTMPSRGGEPVAVNTGAAARWAAFTSWSPDGKRLFFVGMAKPGERARNQECDIFSVSVAGGEPVPVGLGLHTIWFFHIHPDGKRIVFYDEFYPENEIWALKNLPGIAGK